MQPARSIFKKEPDLPWPSVSVFPCSPHPAILFPNATECQVAGREARICPPSPAPPGIMQAVLRQILEKLFHCPAPNPSQSHSGWEYPVPSCLERLRNSTYENSLTPAVFMIEPTAGESQNELRSPDKNRRQLNIFVLCVLCPDDQIVRRGFSMSQHIQKGVPLPVERFEGGSGKHPALSSVCITGSSKASLIS